MAVAVLPLSVSLTSLWSSLTMPSGSTPSSASMKSPRCTKWVEALKACFSGHSSIAMRWPCAVRISKKLLAVVTRSMASKIPSLRNWSMVEGRRPIPAPTSRTCRACS